jgi:hypothetical protein
MTTDEAPAAAPQFTPDQEPPSAPSHATAQPATHDAASAVVVAVPTEDQASAKPARREARAITASTTYAESASGTFLPPLVGRSATPARNARTRRTARCMAHARHRRKLRASIAACERPRDSPRSAPCRRRAIQPRASALA